MSTKTKQYMSVQLSYGMKLLFPANPVSIFIPSMGIALSSSGNEEMTEFTVSKYWDDDTNPEAYKVKLLPTEDKRFGIEKVYSSDLKNMIERGTVVVL